MRMVAVAAPAQRACRNLLICYKSMLLIKKINSASPLAFGYVPLNTGNASEVQIPIYRGSCL